MPTYLDDGTWTFDAMRDQRNPNQVNNEIRCTGLNEAKLTVNNHTMSEQNIAIDFGNSNRISAWHVHPKSTKSNPPWRRLPLRILASTMKHPNPQRLRLSQPTVKPLNKKRLGHNHVDSITKGASQMSDYVPHQSFFTYKSNEIEKIVSFSSNIGERGEVNHWIFWRFFLIMLYQPSRWRRRRMSFTRFIRMNFFQRRLRRKSLSWCHLFSPVSDRQQQSCWLGKAGKNRRRLLTLFNACQRSVLRCQFYIYA